MPIQKKSLVGKTTAKDTTPAKAKTSAPVKQKMETTSKLRSLKGAPGLTTLKSVHNA